MRDGGPLSEAARLSGIRGSRRASENADVANNPSDTDGSHKLHEWPASRITLGDHPRTPMRSHVTIQRLSAFPRATERRPFGTVAA